MDTKTKVELEIKNFNRTEIAFRLEELISIESEWTNLGETSWSKDNFFYDLPDKFRLSKIAISDGNVAGYLIGSRDVKDNKIAKLNKIVTAQDYKRQGIATKLWNCFLNDLREDNVKRLEFKVLTDNYGAINFYEENGCLIDDIEIGLDNKKRFNVYYVFETDEIHHSKPTIGDEEIISLVRTISGRNLGEGENVRKLITILSNYVEKNYGVGTNSGANGIFLALRSLDVKEGDEVILPSYLCGSVLHSVEMTKAKPVVVDINFNGFNINEESVSSNINSNTKTIIVPHLFGTFVKDIEKIKLNGVPVIEDCAQSLGTKFNGKPAGSFGDISVFSFYPTKMIASCYGGVVLTDNISLYEKMSDLLENDNRKVWGEAYSMKLNDISASIAIAQFSKLPDFIKRRKHLAQTYNRLLEGFYLPENSNGDVSFRYIIRSSDASKIIDNLNSRGIKVARPIFKPLHQYLNLDDKNFNNTKRAYNEAISIPIYPELSDDKARYIASSLLNWRFEKK